MGNEGPIVIAGSTISKTGECLERGKASRYLVKEARYNCYKCMVINMKHINVIQYKESYCDDAISDLGRLCLGITGDALLISMFRVQAAPVPCPIRGPLTFTYSKGYGECANPVSQVDSCSEDYRLLFRHQACADVPGSESFNEELVCLGSWKEGSNHYLVGKIGHIHAKSDEDRYRCFILERPRHPNNAHTWNLAQSADATCQGLISAHEGSKTMKLTKESHSGRKCHFPGWVSAPGRHWLTLDGRHSYFLYHKNTSIRISNGTQAPENFETRGHTDIRMVCNRYENHHHHHATVTVSTTTTTTTTTAATDHHHDNNHDGSKHHMNEDVVTIVAHVTVGCKSGFQCLRLYRRDQHVIQVQGGELAFNPEEACSTHYWNPATANLTTLVSAGGRSSSCGPYGHYKAHGSPGNGHGGEGDGCSSVTGRTYTHVTVGCSSDEGNILKLDVACPEKSVLKYHCNGRWEAEGVTYVVASPMSRASAGPRRVCFTYTPVPPHPSYSHTHTITARHDVCEASPRDAHIAINVTLEGQCVQAPGSSTSQSSCGRTPPLLALTLPLLLSLSSLSLPSLILTLTLAILLHPSIPVSSSLLISLPFLLPVLLPQSYLSVPSILLALSLVVLHPSLPLSVSLLLLLLSLPFLLHFPLPRWAVRREVL